MTFLQNNYYADIFFHPWMDENTSPMQIGSDCLLVFVYSGELTVRCKGCTTTTGKGEYIFLYKDPEMSLTQKGFGEQPFQSLCVGFSRSFLREFYCHSYTKKFSRQKRSNITENSIFKLPQSPYLDSLYISMLPYLQKQVMPSRQVVNIKLQEAVHCLLSADKQLHSYLFSFLSPQDTLSDSSLKCWSLWDWFC